MQYWEYKVIKISTSKTHEDNETFFNKLGAEGWELVNIDHYPRLYSYAYFKRLKSN